MLYSRTVLESYQGAHRKNTLKITPVMLLKGFREFDFQLLYDNVSVTYVLRHIATFAFCLIFCAVYSAAPCTAYFLPKKLKFIIESSLLQWRLATKNVVMSNFNAGTVENASPRGGNVTTTKIVKTARTNMTVVSTQTLHKFTS